MLLPENIANKAVMFPEIKAITDTGHHTSGILTTMLEYRQCVVEIVVDLTSAYQTDYAAHKPSFQELC